MRKQRADPDYSIQERKNNTQKKTEIRQDPVQKKQEQVQKRNETKRKNPAKRKQDYEVNVESLRKRRKVIRSTYEGLLGLYNNQIRESPTLICSCCGGLWYRSSTVLTSEEKLDKAGRYEDFIDAVLRVPQPQHRFCKTCNSSVKIGKVPKLALSNGFGFPELPDELKVSKLLLPTTSYSPKYSRKYGLQDLSPLEERLVALRIPFMQIR